MDKQYFLDKLNKTKPSVFKTYNYDLLPDVFLAHDKVAIQCYEHGVFYQKAGMHLFSAGCPECGKKKSLENRAITTDSFIERSRKKFGNKFDYSKAVYSGIDNELTLVCPKHGEISETPHWHYWSKNGCRKCDNETYLSSRKAAIFKKAAEVHGGKYDYSKVNYVDANTKVEIICPIHGSFWQTMTMHVHVECDCPKCARDNDKVTQEEFIKRSLKLHGGRYDYSKVKYVTGCEKVLITCKKHGDFWQRASSHLEGRRCKKCFIEDSRLPLDEFLKAARAVHGDSFDYSKVKYVGNKTEVEIVCPIHGSFWMKPNSHTSSRNGCRFCCESKGEREIEQLLLKYGIEHTREYRVLPYLYRYDFYLPRFNVFIEFHGTQHYMPVNFFGGKEAHLKTKENDLIKTEIVKSLNAGFIVISYRTFTFGKIEEELIAGLKKSFRYWFLVDGKTEAYRKIKDVRRAFGVSLNVPDSSVVSEIKKSMESFSVLF